MNGFLQGVLRVPEMALVAVNKVRDALAAEKDFPGVTGDITIDANRNASKPAVILTITNGVFQYVETVKP